VTMINKSELEAGSWYLMC